MKKIKKILVTLLAGLMVGAGAVGMASCELLQPQGGNVSSGQTSEEKNQFQKVYDMYVVYAEAQGQTPLSYELWLMSIRGEDGKDGAQGPQGEKGDKGDQGEQGIQGEKGDKGDQGEKGDKGDQGEQGIQGVGIEKVECDESDNLVITFTDGTTQTVEMPKTEEHVHTFGDWTVFSNKYTPCEQKLFFRVCATCNSIEWKQGIYEDHDWGSEYSYDNSFHWIGCQQCEETKEYAEHTYNGLECTVCGYEKAQTKTYTVSFDYNYDGAPAEALKSLTVVDGGSVASRQVQTLSRTGYKFVGWNTEKIATTAMRFPYKPTADTTLYAIWEKASYTVTFDKNYEGSTADTVKVEFEGIVVAPETDPTRDGFVFQGWMNKEEDGEVVIFPYEVKGDITFYASWISEQTKVYTVSFDYNYDGAPAEALKSLSVVDGSSVISRQVPSLRRDGYKFIGWNTEKTATSVMRFPYKPTADTTLYAIWEKLSFTVTYKYNMPGASGDFAKTANLNYGDAYPQPASNPTRPGHTFLGWYTTSLGGEPVKFADKVTGSATFFAHWKSDAVVTDTFHAEFTEFDPLEEFPGYSGAAYGAGTIATKASHTGLIMGANDYPTNSAKPTVEAHFVTYMYKKGATLTFKIYASVATTATFSVNVASEFVTNVAVAPTGANAWKVNVNGTALNYTPFTIVGELNANSTTPFQLFNLGTVNLKAGENVIEFVTDNTNTIIGGTTKAFAPMMDCIKLTGASASLSYHPIYDNLWPNSLQ